jgi:hypothetical protein
MPKAKPALHPLWQKGFPEGLITQKFVFLRRVRHTFVNSRGRGL